MKSKLIPSTLVVAAMILAIPSIQAQNIGFRVGIAAPISPSVMAPMTSPILPFVRSPIAGIGVAPIVTPPLTGTFTGPSYFRPGFPGHPVRNVGRPALGGTHRRPVIAPGAIVYAPGAVIVAPAPLIVLPDYTNPGYYAPQPTHTYEAPVGGLSRAQVITQFGHPSVSIVTRSGETLHYPNGVVIVLQDGFVVTR